MYLLRAETLRVWPMRPARKRGQSTSLRVQSHEGTVWGVLGMFVPGFIGGLPPVQVLAAQEAGHIILAPRKGAMVEAGGSKLWLD